MVFQKYSKDFQLGSNKSLRVPENNDSELPVFNHVSVANQQILNSKKKFFKKIVRGD